MTFYCFHCNRYTAAEPDNSMLCQVCGQLYEEMEEYLARIRRAEGAVDSYDPDQGDIFNLEDDGA